MIPTKESLLDGLIPRHSHISADKQELEDCISYFCWEIKEAKITLARIKRHSLTA